MRIGDSHRIARALQENPKIGTNQQPALGQEMKGMKPASNLYCGRQTGRMRTYSRKRSLQRWILGPQLATALSKSICASELNESLPDIFIRTFP
jgi:hypothetical protein